jgi:hypothetical protein
MSAPGGRGDRLPILSLDFDGVIHDYHSGWKDGRIYGAVTPGFFAWAEDAAKRFTLIIHSSRGKTPEGRAAMAEWLGEQAALTGNIGIEGLFTIAAEKPPAFVTIDDRCVRFDGDWSDPDLNPAELRSFKPWMSRDTP